MGSVVLLSKSIKYIKLISNALSRDGDVFFYIDNMKDAKKFLLDEKIDVAIVEEGFVKNPVALVQTLRNMGCNTSFIYIGDGDKAEVRYLLKNGYYDYLYGEVTESELRASIEEAMENKYAYERLRSLAEQLERSNENLRQRTRELEIEKYQLNETIEILKLIDSFVKELNKYEQDNGIDKLINQYLKKKFSGKYFLVTRMCGSGESCLISNFETSNLLDDFFDSVDLNSIKMCGKETIIDVFLDNEKVSFVAVPICYKNNYFGSILVENKNLAEHERYYMFLMADHLSLYFFNRKVIDDLKEAREQLIESEKQKTLLNLAVSLNHIINNHLLGISLNVEFLKRKFNGSEDVSKSFEIIEKNIAAIKDVVRKLQNAKRLQVEEYMPGISMLKLIDSNEK